MTKKLPAKVYVKWEEQSGSEGPFLLAGPDFDGMVDVAGKSVVGTYQLVEVTTAEMVVKRAAPKKHR